MKPRTINPKKVKDETWKLSQRLTQFAGRIDQLPDSGQLQQNPLRSVPLSQLPMLF